MRENKSELFEDFIKLSMYIELPFGIYTTNQEGTILSHNSFFENVLKYNNIIDGKTNILEFYQNPEQRNEIIKKFLDPINKNKWNTEILLLRNGSEEIIVKDSCCPIYNENETISYFFNFLIDVTDEYRFGRLFGNLPIGVYQIDKENKFVKVNNKVSNMLGYDEKELLGMDVSKIYLNRQELKHVTETIKKQPYYIENHKFELVKKSGERIWVLLNAFKIPKNGESYYGREGTIQDITEQELSNKLLFHVPVGFYIVRKDFNSEIVEHCNDEYAKLFGYNDNYEVISKHPSIFFENEEEYQKYLYAINEADSNGRPLWGYVIKGKKANGEIVTVEVNSQFIKDIFNNIIGRVGVVRNIGREILLRNKISEITSDIGAVLHTYSTALLNIKLNVEAVSQSLGKDPFDFKKQLDYESIINEVKTYRSSLYDSLLSLIQLLKEKQKSNNIPETIIQKLLIQKINIEEIDISKIDKINIPVLRQTAYHIFNILNDKLMNIIATEEIIISINNILRICGLIALHEINDTVVDIEDQVRYFREYITEEKREFQPESNEDIVSIAKSIVFDFKQFAFSKNIKIHTSFPKEALYIKVVKREIYRAFSNIIHNAIKYSYLRKKGVSFIKVKILKENSQVKISFENYGIPIHKKEIDKGSIFRSGYRGIFSGDKGKVGTGYGLNDAYNIVKKHNGEISIDSISAVKDAKPDDYSKPFITTITVIFNLIKN